MLGDGRDTATLWSPLPKAAWGSPAPHLHRSPSPRRQICWSHAPPFQQRYPETWGGGSGEAGQGVSTSFSQVLCQLGAQHALLSPPFQAL